MVIQMRTMFLAAVLASAAIAGCSKSQSKGNAAANDKAASKVPLISVDDVDRQIASGGCVAVDANGTGTRKKMGVVPGAVLLSDSETFAASELPADKSKALVFYCANTRCNASHTAADRALTAGYSNVKVMGEGIAGWVAAGKKVQTL
jgi:rhodanese-related sulfurtransferase